MKKIVFLLLLAASVSVNAQYRRCCYRGGYGMGWVAPAVVGGVIGYELARPNTVIVQEPVIVSPPQQPVTVAPAPGYHYITAIDPACSCYKSVLVPN